MTDQNTWKWNLGEVEIQTLIQRRLNRLPHRWVEPRQERIELAKARAKLSAYSDYFDRKAAEVVADESSLDLLGKLHERGVLYLSSPLAELNVELDTETVIGLGKLANAGFCELDANRIGITQSGDNFVNALSAFA